MKIEWWVLDGIICLIVLLSALIGAKRGIGDTIIRLLGIAGGLILAVMFGKDFSAYLMETPFRGFVYNKVFGLMRPEQDNYSKSLPSVIGEAADTAANKAAEATSNRITESLIGIIGFVAIVLAVWLVSYIIRSACKRGRNSSIIIGGTDRLVGMLLGIVKGVIIASIAVAALVPATTLFAPDKLPDMISAMQDSYLTKMFYEINPLLTALKAVIFR